MLPLLHLAKLRPDASELVSTGRMHQLRRHMALVGHPVLGDPKYTYGYAKRHPDAAVLLNASEAEQAMSPPFGVSSEHPGHVLPKAR